MSATDQKIAWARRAIDEMRTAQADASRDDFQYHFGAFLALIGALRQFITVDPHKKWIYAMDERDMYYCACIDLRNVDVHVENAVGTPRSEYAVNLHTTLPPISDSSSIMVKRVGETEWTAGDPVSTPPTPPPPPQAETTSTTARFFVNPSHLTSFTVQKHTKLPRSTKAREEAILHNTVAVEVAEKALAFFEHTVLPGAKAQGIPIP